MLIESLSVLLGIPTVLIPLADPAASQVKKKKHVAEVPRDPNVSTVRLRSKTSLDSLDEKGLVTPESKQRPATSPPAPNSASTGETPSPEFPGFKLQL